MTPNVPKSSCLHRRSGDPRSDFFIASFPEYDLGDSRAVAAHRPELSLTHVPNSQPSSDTWGAH